jgi:glucosamine--fructose-6-phosphate aminotransferase (isomerizing)
MTEYTLNEIHSQPEVWQQIVELCEEREHQKITEWMFSSQPVLTGCGSSFYLCLAAAAVFTQLSRRRALAVSASEICTFPSAIFSEAEAYSLLAVSRNGKSPETVGAARWFNDSRSAKPVAVSTVTSSPLLEVCEPGLLLTAAAERSRYMTRSFTAGLLALCYLIASNTGNHELVKELRRLPEICRRAIGSCRSTVKFLAEEKQFDDYVGLGQGPFYGLAAESMLKVKEMVRAPAEAYPSLEVMHGPNYLLSKKTLVALLHADSAKSYECALLERLQASGACKFVICEKASAEIRERADFVFELSSGLSELAHLVLAMPVMQLFAYYRARAAGNPLE